MFSFLYFLVFSRLFSSDILVYNDTGVSQECVMKLFEWFQSFGFRIDEINAEKLIQKGIPHKTRVFIIPGGADLEYCKKLNGRGNFIIKEFVKNGGVYFGICAGAYYASARCDFHKNDKRGYEVLGDRELSFYKGVAEGPTLSDYYYHSEKGARVAHIAFQDENPQIKYFSYYNGGCHFKSAEQYPDTKIIAWYKNKKVRMNAYANQSLPAIIECKYGKGRAILSGVHPEYLIKDGSCALWIKILHLLLK